MVGTGAGGGVIGAGNVGASETDGSFGTKGLGGTGGAGDDAGDGGTGLVGVGGNGGDGVVSDGSGGAGVKGTGGAKGGTDGAPSDGPGVEGVGGGTNGVGVQGTGVGTGVGVYGKSASGSVAGVEGVGVGAGAAEQRARITALFIWKTAYRTAHAEFRVPPTDELTRSVIADAHPSLQPHPTADGGRGGPAGRPRLAGESADARRAGGGENGSILIYADESCTVRGTRASPQEHREGVAFCSIKDEAGVLRLYPVGPPVSVLYQRDADGPCEVATDSRLARIEALVGQLVCLDDRADKELCRQALSQGRR